MNPWKGYRCGTCRNVRLVVRFNRLLKVFELYCEECGEDTDFEEVEGESGERVHPQ